MKRFPARKKKILLLVCLAVIFIVLGVWLLRGNMDLTVTRYELDILPEEGSFTIAQVSDLHNVQFGQGNQELLALLEDVKPDMIAVTGDLIDSRSTNLSVASNFMERAVKIAPVYYVTGNHEARVRDAYQTVKDAMEAAGVEVLEDEVVPIPGQPIELVGLDEGAFDRVPDQALVDSAEWNLQLALDELSKAWEGETNVCRVLLTHRPEYVELYAQYDVDLVLAGHAHGGQIRVPGLGGLYAPGQGFLPDYEDGLHQVGETRMIVSRGLGNSIFPLRVNNPPELVVVTLT